MFTLSNYQQQAQDVLVPIYGDRETSAVIKLWFGSRLDMSPIDLIMRREEEVAFPSFGADLARLKANTPVQLVLGEAFFFDRLYLVNEHTLIPRPETEELVAGILERFSNNELKVIDVGTGSGCIAISLQLARPNWSITGVDIDRQTIDAAKANAEKLGANVDFKVLDVLEKGLSEFDLLVSNPPYIPQIEAQAMDSNVVDYEPDRALFVPNSDALLFYRRLLELAKENKKDSPVHVAFEIHEDFGEQMIELCASFGFKEVNLLQDLQGKDRMIFAQYGD
ncbi:MAG: peptide chain release factor N(5)-glutamine methyltransferase [Schleiferiaceae bacterium]